MKNEIIDYLTVKKLEDTNFNEPAPTRLRKAYMLAQSKYASMSEKEKKELFDHICKVRPYRNGTDGGI